MIRIADGQIVEDRQGNNTNSEKKQLRQQRQKEISKNLNFAGAIKLAFKNMKEKRCAIFFGSGRCIYRHYEYYADAFHRQRY